MNLIEILKRETATLRIQYLEKVKGWAETDFARIVKLANSPYPNYADFATPGFVKSAQHWCDYAQGKKYQKTREAREKANRIKDAGYEIFLQRELKLAEMHYEDSIVKLAARIEKKELDQTKLTIKTAHVGVNIETVFTDGTKTVKAWTIIASGPIQKPHYRYLVK
jgi:hypothetical protein